MKSIMISIFRHARCRNASRCSLQPLVCTDQKRNVNSQTKIKIPKRIERGPTDILEALASTVKRDPTANHYKFPDDPHFSINTQMHKRITALALESGRKAAWWVVEENQKLFKHKVANPPIEAFAPPDDHKYLEGTEEALVKAINETRVLDAIGIYQTIQKKKEKVELKDESKQKLLELCCFYNSLDHDDDRLIESKWYMKTEMETSYKTWQSDGFAENLFVEMDNEPNAVCAVIQGRIKYNDVQGGYELYRRAIIEGVPLTTEVYNCLLGAAGSLKQNDEDRWKLILDFLKEMNDKKVPVNLRTFNSALKIVSNFGRLMKTEETLLPLLAEFQQLGINPSLGSYYYILKHYVTRNKRPAFGLMDKILREIEGKKFEIQHESDVLFFPYAMKACEMIRDPLLGRRLHEVALNGQNYNFIADDLSESKYYKYLFHLIFREEPIESAMALYKAMVPKIYSPEYQVFQKVIETISENGAIEYFPIIWDNIVLIESRSLKLFETLSKALVANPPVGNEFKDFYAKVATYIFQTVEESKQYERSTLQWSSELISNLFTLYIRAGKLENSLKLLREAEKDVSLEIDSSPLSEFLELCISQQRTSLALECLRYAYERGLLNVIEMAKRIKSELALNDEQASFVQQAMES